LIITEEVEAHLVFPSGSVLEADPRAHDREEGPRAGDSVTRRRPGPGDVLAIDPVIMSDNISAFSGVDDRSTRRIIGSVSSKVESPTSS
jgi:hypothetical protein